MILECTNEYNGLVLFYKKLEEISTILKEGRTTQARVMNFILTMLNCMILKVDNQTCLHEFIGIFNDRSMQVLRNDLENLLCFKTKFFNFLILELLLEAVRKENNVKLIVDTPCKQWNKVVFQKRVKAIVKFLIFRKAKKSSYLYDGNDMSDWFSYKQKVSIVLNNEINSGDNFIMNKNNLKDNRVKDTVNCARYERESQYTDDVKIFKQHSNTKFNFYETSMYTCIRHLCTKVYCLFWLAIFMYGWLAVFMYYCCRSFHQTFLSVIHKSINEQS
ncbi:hypothetical protein QLX08_009897 [Tetragonisca angustula]|uniref:Uncharacterized protein n=1 Tax=Tetragonisca angustula TaxID=166442 RepID=A0AAW0ZEB4_9HYME